MNTYEALIEAGKERLRPILMTTFAGIEVPDFWLFDQITICDLKVRKILVFLRF